MPLLTEQQSLLLKSCFLTNGARYFQQWLATYSETDLDYYTRALIPSLLAARSLDLPPELQKKMLLYKRQTWLVNTLKWQQLKPLLDDFSMAGIPSCLLKGAAMVFLHYNDVSQRPEYSDIDILISQQNLEKAHQIIKKHHYHAQNTFRWSSEKIDNNLGIDKPFTSALHAVHYKKNNLIIDLHWRLFPLIPGLNFESLQDQMLSHHRLGNELLFLSTEMQFIHTAAHVAFQDRGYASLNSIIDLCFMFHKSALNFEKLFHLSYEAGLSEVVYLTLSKLQPYLDGQRYNDCMRYYKPYHKPIFSNHFPESLLFSPNKIKRRFGQSYFLIKKNNYNPLKSIINVRNYFGIENYKQLWIYIYNRCKASFFTEKLP